jgi:phosphatidylinositol alpha-mannosyltransferase
MLPASVRERVHMLGTIKHPDLPGYFAAADVFVSPATGQESFGIVLVEAMAAGVPVVASDIPGYREVIRGGESGVLVPPGDSASLARAVSEVLTRGPASTEMVAAGRQAATEYSWDRVTGRIEAVYEQSAGQGALAR